MTGVVALKSAYAVTIVVQLLYIRYLVGRYRRVKSELKDLKRSS
jgi:hypothetical protein